MYSANYKHWYLEQLMATIGTHKYVFLKHTVVKIKTNIVQGV